MAAPPDSLPGRPADPDRLNGWKEIAAFLGKGVRTAQRWERDLGLPVQRLGRDGGEIVLASRRELGQWIQEQARRPAADVDAAQALLPLPPPGVSTGARAAARGWLPIAAGLALLLGGTIVVWLGVTEAAPPAPADPADWKVLNGVLRTYDEDGRELWQFHPGYAIRDTGFDGPAERRPGGHVALRDLDGDGRREVLFAARSEERDPAMAFFVLNGDGTTRFSVRPAHRVTFGDEEFAGPWLPHHIWVGPPEGGRSSIYVVFIHLLMFPTLLLELDPDGTVLAEYWSNGYVETVAPAVWKGRPVLFVGAANNDTRGASLAIFDGGRAAGSAPSAQHKYRCTSCPAGEPSAFVVFPQRDIARAYGGVGAVGHVYTDEAGAIWAYAYEGGIDPAGGSTAAVIYKLSGTLQPMKAEVATGLRVLHEELRQKGLLDHVLGPTPDARDFFPVRLWKDGRFISLGAAPIEWQ